MVEQSTAFIIFAFSGSGICWPPLSGISHMGKLLMYLSCSLLNEILLCSRLKNKQSETNKNFMIHQLFLFLLFVWVLILWLSACHVFSWDVLHVHPLYWWVLCEILMKVFRKWCWQALTQCNARDNISLKDSVFHAPHLSNAFLLMCLEWYSGFHLSKLNTFRSQAGSHMKDQYLSYRKNFKVFKEDINSVNLYMMIHF